MAPANFTLESSAFKNQGEIPAKYTCEGQDISPPLRWKGAPAGTKSFAIIVDDPEAPGPAAPWVHWILYNIPADVASLPEDIHAPPKGAHEGLNDWKASGYRGPCPPIGRHHYHHKIYALDTMLPDLEKSTKADLERAMKGHILGEADLVATYQKIH
jgi:Raf kinase inhibitor-like YbhB/YbcL family protein